MRVMEIWKALNNNVAVVLDSSGREKIVMGKGICFKKTAGDQIADGMIDKTFLLSGMEANSKFQVLVQDIPMEHITVGEKIIAEAKTKLDGNLNDMVYISLIDHVHTAIIRFQEGIAVKNILLWDIRRFYRDEYAIGLWGLGLIEKKCGVRLPEDEAGFIALHLANARIDEDKMHNMYEITHIMQEILNIVRRHFRVAFNEDDVYFYRFVTHLKFFATRLTEHRLYTKQMTAS